MLRSRSRGDHLNRLQHLDDDAEPLRQAVPVSSSSRRKPHLKLAAGRLGVSQRRLDARQGVTTLQPGDRGLADGNGGLRAHTVPVAAPAAAGARAHPTGYGLSESCRPRTLARLSELEYIALGIMAVADLGAFEFPLAFHGMHGAAQLCRSL